MYFLDLLNIGVMVISKDQKVIYVNKWLKRRLVDYQSYMSGASLQELLNLDEKHERLSNCLKDASGNFKGSILSDKLNNLPFLLSSNGTYLNYNLCISPLTQGVEEQKSVLLQFLDITPVKKRELYLIKKQKELEQQREIVFSQERMSSLGELTSSIAHEINNPLAMLELANKTIRKLVNKDEIDINMLKEILDDNDKVMDRISGMIKGIRNLSRKPNEDDFREEALGDILNDIRPVFNQLFKTHEIDLRVDNELDVLTTPIPLLRVLVSQVFINLFNNAIFEIKTKEHENPFIEVSGEMRDDYAVVFFTDSGQGIPKEVQEKIFHPFYTTKDFGQGTGLGLSTIYKIMENHGGKIEIDNDHLNTRFVLSFPLKK